MGCIGGAGGGGTFQLGTLGLVQGTGTKWKEKSHVEMFTLV